jgi:hemerythrin-like metal-binding protein
MTGFERIDGEHRCIADSLDTLLAAVNAARPPEVVAALGAVLQAFRVHFEHEEALMLQARYPHAARHKEAHDLFLADGARFYGEVQQRGLTVEVRRWATGRALEWFRLHIAMNDVGLGHYLNAQPQFRGRPRPEVQAGGEDEGLPGEPPAGKTGST